MRGEEGLREKRVVITANRYGMPEFHLLRGRSLLWVAVRITFLKTTREAQKLSLCPLITPLAKARRRIFPQ